jgi:CubicO group peptidase (beta-lactamase class C family)
MKKVIFLLLVLVPSLIFAQQFNSEKLDSLLHSIEKADKAMFSLAIHEDGKPIYTRAIGYADVESELKANPNTMYRVGSISKSFTAAIILKLVEEKILGLEDNLAKFYPNLPNANKITVKELLNHHSGLFNFTNKDDYTSWMEKKTSKKELLKLFKTNGTAFEPGEKGEYSNTNYVLLTWIAEDASGKDFTQLLEKYIVTPLKLERTRYQGDIQPKNNEAYSYKMGNTWLKETETDMSVPLGAGAIVSTPTDLNKFYIALFNGEILSEESLEQMKRLEDNFGLGLFKFPFYDKYSFGHTGGIDGFSSMAGYFPVENLAISITSNASNLSLNEVVLGALSIYFEMDYQLPTYKKAVQLEKTILEQYVGTYASEGFPLDIKIFLKNGTLQAQATGQSSFPLTAVSSNTFEFSQAKIVMEFMPKESKMNFSQAGASYMLKKK